MNEVKLLFVLFALTMSSCSGYERFAKEQPTVADIEGEWELLYFPQQFKGNFEPSKVNIQFDKSFKFNGSSLPFIERYGDVRFVDDSGHWEIENYKKYHKESRLHWVLRVNYKALNFGDSWEFIQRENELMLKVPHDLDSGDGFVFRKKRR